MDRWSLPESARIAVIMDRWSLEDREQAKQLAQVSPLSLLDIVQRSKSERDALAERYLPG